MRRTLLPLIALLAGVLTACTTAVGGSGHVGLPTSSPTDRPGGGTGATVSCPTVSAPEIGLSFRCVTSGIAMTPDPLWPLSLVKQVEPGWVLGEGAGVVGGATSMTLAQLTGRLRTEMVSLGSWGPNPGVHTVANKATKVAGVDAWLLQTTFTINAAYRQAQHLKVRTERTWIVALHASGQRIAVWYVTLPDEVKNLWPTVPALISSIKLI